MKFVKLLKFCIIVISGAVFAEGGSMGSGGGMVVSCDDGRVELLDVYEAKKRYGEHAIIKSTGEFFQDYFNLMKSKFKLQTSYFSSESLEAITENNFYAFHKRLVYMQNLDNSKDQGQHLPLESGCKLQQVAIFFDDRDEILINEAIYQKMDMTSKAALIMHEHYYFFERKIGETTSETTRLHVGQILSTKIQTPWYKGRNRASYKCKSKNIEQTYSGADFELFVINENNASTYLFKNLNGRPIFVKTHAESKQKFGRIYMDEKINIVAENRTLSQVVVKKSFLKDKLELVLKDNQAVNLECTKIK